MPIHKAPSSARSIWLITFVKFLEKSAKTTEISANFPIFPVILISLFLTAFLSFFLLEPKVYDYMVKNVMTQRLSSDKNKNIYGHDDVVLVIVDNKSIEKYRWPWKEICIIKFWNILKIIPTQKLLHMILL